MDVDPQDVRATGKTSLKRPAPPDDVEDDDAMVENLKAYPTKRFLASLRKIQPPRKSGSQRKK